MKLFTVVLSISLLLIVSGCTSRTSQSPNVASATPDRKEEIYVKWERKQFTEQVGGVLNYANLTVTTYQTKVDWDGDGTKDQIEIRYDDPLRTAWEQFKQAEWKRLISSYRDPDEKPLQPPAKPNQKSCEECLVHFSVNGSLIKTLLVQANSPDENIDRSFFYQPNRLNGEKQFALYDEKLPKQPKLHTIINQ